MQLILSIIPIFTLMLTYAAVLRFAAKLTHKSSVSLLHALLFALMLICSAVLVNVIALTLEFSISFAMWAILGLIAVLVLGGWFFSTRISTEDGGVVGWQGATQLAGLSWLFFIVICFMLVGILHFLSL